MSDLFLSRDELSQLTGYDSPKHQFRWLISRGWIIEINRKKEPVVLRSYAEKRLGGDPTPARQKQKINLEAV